MRCARCQSTQRQIKYGFTPSGSQGYRCQECGCRYTPEPKAQGHTGETRALAVRMVLEGMSFRAIGRVLKVSPQSVGNWVKASANRLPDAPLPEDIDIAELDELFTYIASKKTRSTS